MAGMIQRLMTKHPRKTLMAVLHPSVALIGLGAANLLSLPWWGGVLMAFGAMIVVGVTAG